jgi:hypothetical protein
MRKSALLTFLLVLLIACLKAQNLEVAGKAKITEMDTVTDVSSNVVRQSDGTLAVRQYQIGDLAHGGIIFWVDETGEHGLVCDTADLGTGIQWYNGVSRVTNTTGDGVRAGEMNTTLIIAQQTADNIAGSFAALLCANLVRGPYGDWYLPSREELKLMCQNKTLIDSVAIANGGSGFDSSYWSSTEIDGSFAWSRVFLDCSDELDSKFNPSGVRAVRGF